MNTTPTTTEVKSNRYRVLVTWTMEAYINVDAHDEDEAEEKAMEESGNVKGKYVDDSVECVSELTKKID